MIEDDDGKLYWVCLNSLKSSEKVCLSHIIFMLVFSKALKTHYTQTPPPQPHITRPQPLNGCPNPTPHTLGQIVGLGFSVSQASTKKHYQLRRMGWTCQSPSRDLNSGWSCGSEQKERERARERELHLAPPQ